MSYFSRQPILFKIKITGGDECFATSPESAFAAYYQLKRDRGIMGTKATIKNLVTGKVVFADA
jgi:hypothetical protein